MPSPALCECVCGWRLLAELGRRASQLAAGRHPGVEYDPGQPLFSQLGGDAREASAERGEAGLAQLVEALVKRITGFLADAPG